jgi:hypothetical protein
MRQTRQIEGRSGAELATPCAQGSNSVDGVLPSLIKMILDQRTGAPSEEVEMARPDDDLERYYENSAQTANAG